LKIVYVIWILYLPLTYSLFGQEVLIPSSSNVKDKVLFTKESNEVIGEGFFPVSYNEANYSFPMKDTLRNQSWIVRKLVNEHFVQLQKEDFLLTIDPLFNLSIGKELLQEMPHHLFQNTREPKPLRRLKINYQYTLLFMKIKLVLWIIKANTLPVEVSCTPKMIQCM